MRPEDMLIETPVSEAELDRPAKPGHEGMNQCTYCGVGPEDPWYPTDDVMVVRHWKQNTPDDPGAGHWTWYCPDHFDNRNGTWWKWSHTAPAHLLPEIHNPCERYEGLGSYCGADAVDAVAGSWYCAIHAGPARMLHRLDLIEAGIDVEDV